MPALAHLYAYPNDTFRRQFGIWHRAAADRDLADDGRSKIYIIHSQRETTNLQAPCGRMPLL